MLLVAHRAGERRHLRVPGEVAFFGWALVRALSEEGITVFRLPYTSLAVIVLLAALAGMIAAIGPSRRAAKLDVLKAVVTE